MLVFIGGESLYGKVDTVPGWFYVKTKFVHVYFLPLIPQQSFLILEGSEKQDQGVGAPQRYQGVGIPLCRRSVAFAWLRHGCALLATIGFVLAGVCVMVTRDPINRQRGGDMWNLALLFAGGATVLLLLAALTWLRVRATPARAVELCRLAGLDPQRLYYRFTDRVSRQELETLVGRTNDLEMDLPAR